MFGGMYIVNPKTGDIADVMVQPVLEKEYTVISRSNNFKFDWNQEKDSEVYKLTRIDSEEILGLMSLVSHPGSITLEIHLLEVSKNNIGRNKEYDRIAGCLIASAARLSVLKGFRGSIFLKAKTKLIRHYKEKYGMRTIKMLCYLEPEDARKIILLYAGLNDIENDS